MMWSLSISFFEGLLFVAFWGDLRGVDFLGISCFEGLLFVAF